MEKRKEIFEFLYIIIKCFFILFIFGSILPKVIEYVLSLCVKQEFYNSTFVSSIVDKHEQFIINYIFIFKSFFQIL